MDDIAERISKLLSDEGGMEKIKNMAEALFGNSENSENTAERQDETTSATNFSLPDGVDISKIMGLVSAFGNMKSDRRTELLLALKPHLSVERRERVDKAVKLLKLAALLPLIKEQGLLDIL